MYDHFLHMYSLFRENGFEEPLVETLHLFDLLSGGAIRQIDQSLRVSRQVDIHEVVQKRLSGMPQEYILGKAAFMGLDLVCSPDTLIPRSETELLAQKALEFINEIDNLKSSVTVADVGTGCGNLAIALALHSDVSQIIACDISAEAVRIADINVRKYGLQNRVKLFQGDLFAPCAYDGYENKLDIIVCNPPYIPSASLNKLSSEIIDYEPVVALDAGGCATTRFDHVWVEGSLNQELDWAVVGLRLFVECSLSFFSMRSLLR